MSSHLTIDTSDATLAALCSAAGRIAALFGNAKIGAAADVQGCLDDFLGAVYALIRARQLGYRDRPAKPIAIAPVMARAKSMSTGRVKVDGKWNAGFYFNGALFRIAGVYHRVLKIVGKRPVNCREFPHTILPDVETFYRSETRSSWLYPGLKAVYKQVNELKRQPHGVYYGRMVTFQEAFDSIDELLKLVEAWSN